MSPPPVRIAVVVVSHRDLPRAEELAAYLRDEGFSPYIPVREELREALGPDAPVGAKLKTASCGAQLRAARGDAGVRGALIVTGPRFEWRDFHPPAEDRELLRAAQAYSLESGEFMAAFSRRCP